MADPAEQLHVVTFELHSGSATESEAAPREFVTNLLDGDIQPGRESFDHHDEGGSVGFPRSQIAQHDRLRLEGHVLGARDVAKRLRLLEDLFANAQVETGVRKLEIRARGARERDQLVVLRERLTGNHGIGGSAHTDTSGAHTVGLEDVVE